MKLVLERLPEATVVSVGHRPSWSVHTRKLVLEYHPDVRARVRRVARAMDVHRTARSCRDCSAASARARANAG